MHRRRQNTSVLQVQSVCTLHSGDWQHRRPFRSEKIVSMAKYAKARHLALSFNLLMYEDGTVSPDSLEAVRLFGETARTE